MLTDKHTFTHKTLLAHMHTHLRAHTHPCMHTHIPACTHTQTHTHTHTHTHTQAQHSTTGRSGHGCLCVSLDRHAHTQLLYTLSTLHSTLFLSLLHKRHESLSLCSSDHS